MARRRFRGKNKYRGIIGKKGRAIALNSMGRMMNRGFGINRYMRYKNPTHFFKRVVGGSQIGLWHQDATAGLTITQDNSKIINFAMSSQANHYGSIALGFKLDDLYEANEYTTLFDRYQITSVSIKVIPLTPYSLAFQNVTTQNNGNGSISCLLHSVTDYDDYTTFPASEVGVNQMREYESYKVRNLGAGGAVFKYYVKPRIALSSYRAGVFSGFANAKNFWVDCASADVQYFGKKFIFEINNPNSPAGGVPTWYNIKMELTYYLKLKDLR